MNKTLDSSKMLRYDTGHVCKHKTLLRSQSWRGESLSPVKMSFALKKNASNAGSHYTICKVLGPSACRKEAEEEKLVLWWTIQCNRRDWIQTTKLRIVLDSRCCGKSWGSRSTQTSCSRGRIRAPLRRISRRNLQSNGKIFSWHACRRESSDLSDRPCPRLLLTGNCS